MGGNGLIVSFGEVMPMRRNRLQRQSRRAFWASAAPEVSTSELASWCWARQTLIEKRAPSRWQRESMIRAARSIGAVRTRRIGCSNTGKISWKTAGAVGRHQPLKFLSSHPRVPDDGRDRALDGGRQEVQPLRPSGRDYDPDWLSPRLAGVRVVRSAMVAGRAGHRPATRPQGEERLAECPPDAGRRDTRAAASAARTGAVLARLYDRAGRADDAQSLPCAIRSDRGSGQDAIPDPSAHATAWLRLRPSQRWPRHQGVAGVARPQEHPAHGALHRAGTGQVQKFLALRRVLIQPCPLWGKPDIEPTL